MRFIKTALLCLVALTTTLSINTYAAPKSELWEYWLQHDPQSKMVISHNPWNQFLSTYVETNSNSNTAVKGINTLKYASVTAADKQALKSYIATLTALPISQYNRNQQRAYWINLYNALTVDVVLDHYPVKSIMDIKLSGLFTRGPWKKELISVEQQPLSLNDIEHRILRPIWKDPRTHYAVNCASLGCPNLSTQAYTAENMEQQLEQAATAFINHPRGVEIKDGTLIVSSIYNWFKEDFGGDDTQVIKHLEQYAKEPLKHQLSTVQSIFDDQYNWQLNEVR
ncbi:DUF547 domain-containing protein [Neptuniibacter sp. 2_MG-2023]|uniref:DUF547 domain-containing protein n=1 Tax=Neptuniibacter sp. 2_MG-2023 TaxID=3062671 RepID=UPI0026E3D480|nr:DUF547 domain-containing protein [Neptuniibacter sp. 2_MG-2023]MDO6512795.1 DUF547 domain-containing protein [Neptuniibacter sp. 2_MG-2023]